MAKKSNIWFINLFLLVFLIILTSCSLIKSDTSDTKENAKAKINADASKETIPPIVCGTGTTLNQQTNQCIIINNGNSESNKATLPPSTLTPPPATNEKCREPSGVFTQLYYRQRNLISGILCGDACKADILGMFRYQGNCPADIYIEAGIPNSLFSISPLSIAPSGYFSAVEGKPSACDNNVHWNGVAFKNVQPNQIVIFELQPEHYNVEGTYPITIGAYTGCLKDGGVTIQSLPSSNKLLLVGFSNKYQRSTLSNTDIDNSWVQLI